MNFYEEIVKISKEAHNEKLKQGTQKFIELLTKEVRAAANEGRFYIQYYATTELEYCHTEVSSFFQSLGFEVDVQKLMNGRYVWIISWEGEKSNEENK